jgi:hypothetical protein
MAGRPLSQTLDTHSTGVEILKSEEDMKEKIKTISWDEWIDTYNPFIDNEGCIIDFDPRINSDRTSKEQLEKAIAENRVWAECDSEDPNGRYGTFIQSGLHRVNLNRIFVTKEPYTEVVLVPDEQDLD